MGNSPSRNELHGDHMSTIPSQTSGQETYQSHNYPAKFSTVPGIHNEQVSIVKSATQPQCVASSSDTQSSQSQFKNNGAGVRNGGHSRGPNTPDLLYSMDSLNVCGNNGTSITSAELPPSSISPENCRDPWSPSSFSDESLHTQCRNLSRLHKDFHLGSTDDDGLISSNFDGDSLNPDATLSGMTSKSAPNINFQDPILRKREGSPQLAIGKDAEIAEEAIEFIKVPLLPISSQETVNSALNPVTTTVTDHSITINGRKVNGCEETPLPINGHSVISSQIAQPEPENISNKSSPPPPPLVPCSSSTSLNGIYANGTVKRGSRMKSPPPPPPAVKSATSPSTSPPANSVNKMTSLNNAMRRNASVDNALNNTRQLCGFPAETKPDSPSKAGATIFSSSLPNGHKKDHAHEMILLESTATIKKANPVPASDAVADTVAVTAKTASAQDNPFLLMSNSTPPPASKRDEKLALTTAGVAADDTANNKENASNDDDPSPDKVIRPCELSVKQKERAEMENATVSEQSDHGTRSDDEAENKSELDCKDGRIDVEGGGGSSSCGSSSSKPVPCAINLKEDKAAKSEQLMTMSTKNETDKQANNNNEEEDGSSKAEEEGKNGGGGGGDVDAVGVDFPEMADEQLDTGRKKGEVMLMIFDELEKEGLKRRSKFFAKFGTNAATERNKSVETNPFAAAVASENDAAKGVAVEVGNGSGKCSNSSSRRSSVNGGGSSSGETNVPATLANNGILNCNRISLCSLQDNEVDVNNFQSPSPPILDTDTILDQPVIGTHPMLITGGNDTGNELQTQTKQLKNEKEDNDVESKNNGQERHHHHHKRKSSMSKIDFGWNNISSNGDNRSVVGSAPTGFIIRSSSGGTNPFEKAKISRKASFPELCINTATLTRPVVKRKHSVGTTSAEKTTTFSETNPFFCKEEKTEFLQALGEIYASKSKLLESKGLPKQNLPVAVPSDLCNGINGKIAATKNSQVEATLEEVPLAEKVCTDQTSFETVDGFDCQDRSISEYNISPRSARELVTELIINAGSSSLASTTVSQVSIVTINDLNNEPVTFGTGVESQNPFTTQIDLPNVVLPQVSLSKGSIDSGTYRKKPSNFSPPKISKDEPVPSENLFQPMPSSSSNYHPENQNLILGNPFALPDDDQPGQPVPPPMPPLQYYRNNSYSSSTAGSSLGDSSSADGQEERKSPCFIDPLKTNQLPILKPVESSNTSSNSSTKSNSPTSSKRSKVNGNGSSECSLVELSVSNPKSTSDAIIVELRKAQARKLKLAGIQQQVDTEDFLIPPEITEDEQKAVVSFEKSSPTVAILQVMSSKCETEDKFGSKRGDVGNGEGGKKYGCEENSRCLTQQQFDNCEQHVVEQPVKAIVNGKHTNSIIVNEVPVVGTFNKKDLVKRAKNGGVGVSGKSTANSFVVQQQGNIMSPSLSGNYTEMNGIDSETMGASSIHEDELSGQLQQKEQQNHINELHGNVEEVQTSNKLDGASFRRVLSEYEKTLSMFIQQIDQLKQRMDDAETEKQTLIKERDQAHEDLRNVESAFSDVHRKYERAKALLENMKSNEDTLIRRDQEMMQRIQNRDKKIDMIKEKAQESIEKMHLDYETRIKEMEFENAKLRAQYRKMEMKLSTLENDVEQKAKENAQLSALCDELINGQVGQV